MYTALKTMGMDERWSRYMGGGYTESHQIGPYKVEMVDDKDDTRIILWNPTRPCVTMVIDRTNNEAVIDVIRYDPDCTSPEKMKRGSGTREMMEFVFDLLRQKGAKKVQLSDASTIVCNGMEIKLGLMYFLKYGETWYEKHFDFHPTPKYKNRYQQLKQRRLKLLDTKFLEKQPCEYFSDDVLQDLLINIKFDFLQVMVWEKDL
jgi:hypothetical protein